jgi:hypothetical protein
VSSLAIIALGGGGLWLSGLAPAVGADHFDPPTRTDPLTTTTPDIAGDLADLYLFPTANNTTHLSVVFGGPSSSGIGALMDPDVDFFLYISNAGSPTDAEITINFRFGFDRTNPNALGVRITGVPGNPNPIILPVESIQTFNGVKVFAGLIDDPFNFDAAGLRETRQTGILSIRNDRNRFTMLNSSLMAFEIPDALIRNGNEPLRAWGRSYRIRSGL